MPIVKIDDCKYIRPEALCSIEIQEWEEEVLVLLCFNNHTMTKAFDDFAFAQDFVEDLLQEHAQS